MTSVFLVGGARPNFMKIAPLYHAMVANSHFAVSLVHTGQHYDDRMATSFLRDLALPEPDVALNVGSGSHGVQTARVLERFEAQLQERQPDLVVVVGDVNSTLACALAAAKMKYPDGRRPLVAHVEAGLRSFDRDMPEEINRILTDSISDFLFVTEQAGVDNLRREGANEDAIFLVGNVMIDTLRLQAQAALDREAWARWGLELHGYAVATLHRPSNVDDDQRLRDLVQVLNAIAARLPVVFPVHPRTRRRMDSVGLAPCEGLLLCEPQPYVGFLSLLTGARLVLTDSGGIQEETTILGVPCLTLRENTERPITVQQGTNRLIGMEIAAIAGAVEKVLAAPMPRPSQPPLWDGCAASRIVTCLERALAKAPLATAGAA